jgi:NADPH:quinone reductase-like Zn-dependent oxidoreductase
MRAAITRGYGGPEVFTIEEVERPRPGAGQLGIRVHASSVNPVDCGIRSGALRAFVRLRLPAILGIDYAGVVEEVGPDVEGFAVGDEVFGFVDIRSCGAYAEHAVVAASTAARKPSALSFTEAGVIGGAGLTAFQALTLSPRAGRTTRPSTASATSASGRRVGCSRRAVGTS